MTESIFLDIIVGVTLVCYVFHGMLTGLSRNIFVIAGVIAGVIAAFFLAPLAAQQVPIPLMRPVATIAAAVMLVALGSAIGTALGRWIRRGVALSPLSGVDRALGAVTSGVLAALIASVIAFSASQLGVPLLSRAIAGSAILRTISSVTPDPVQGFLAQVRGVVLQRGIPLFSGALGTAIPVVPQINTGSAELSAAAQSVVRINGTAYACGTSQVGTGFVVATDRVVTNAHVVAGVSEPVIEALDGKIIMGSITYFDPISDLAVIDAPGLSSPGLPLSPTLNTGEDAAFEGYPYGGPFSSGAADVISVSTTAIADIYGTSTHEREVYTLAADVREGNSGGPLLTLDGRVAGIIFARNPDTPNVGYAITMAELEPLAKRAAELDTRVSSGACLSE
ncbi:MAG: MarP family serine protease [Rhodoglobus sp.]